MQSVNNGNAVHSRLLCDRETFNRLLPLFAGGISATVAQCATCPLDVVQTRLQSTQLKFSGCLPTVSAVNKPIYILQYFQTLASYMKYMTQTEGFRSLCKGLGPGLFGIVPAKSIYFYCYANTKRRLRKASGRGSVFVHSASACFAGIVTATVTNPIWYIKTQLQLNKKYEGIFEIIKKGYGLNGMKSFFRGLSASYVGVSEVIIYFILYEKIKENLHQQKTCGDSFQPSNYILAALTSKIVATSLTYPHEVVRTRLRQDERDIAGRLKYRNFLQTLATVGREEGRVGLYGGFATGLVRQLPSTGVLFLTYEAILYLADRD